jgi:hypothetical protein
MVQLENLITPDGATILSSTSETVGFPEKNILESSLKQFWPTTGMYPQQCIVGFPTDVKVSKIILASRKSKE